ERARRACDQGHRPRSVAQPARCRWTLQEIAMSTAEHIVIDHLVMPRGSSLRIDDGSGIMVRVRWGGAWLTQEADGRDHYLTAGQGFCLDRDGCTLVTALRRA